MGVLKRWHRQEFETDGQTFSAKIKCLNFGEAPAYITKLAEFFEKRDELLPKDNEVAKLTLSQVQALYGTIPPEFVKDAFTKYVKDVVDLKDEEGVEILTGEDLFDIASQRLALDVLYTIMRLANGISDSEGKASPSQPGPSSDPTPIGGEVVAASIVVAVSPQP